MDSRVIDRVMEEARGHLSGIPEDRKEALEYLYIRRNDLPTEIRDCIEDIVKHSAEENVVEDNVADKPAGDDEEKKEKVRAVIDNLLSGEGLTKSGIARELGVEWKVAGKIFDEVVKRYRDRIEKRGGKLFWKEGVDKN